MPSPRFKVEFYDPKTKHVLVYRVSATTAEKAPEIARVRLSLARKRLGRYSDYRVENVTRLSR